MGGAAGHMSHPFDLPTVRNGSDLIKFFEDAATLLTSGPGSVKIDGVNVSFKLVDGPRGKEFAVDRGSLKHIDVEGITADRVGERFAEGHGMRPAITELLSIFNEALPNIEPELKKLGLYDDPTVFFNTEYVKGTTNILQYDEDFLAIHGVNQFYEKQSRIRGKAYRPGAERPIDPKTDKPVKDPSREIPYDRPTLLALIKKVNPYAGRQGFKIYGDVPTETVGEIDFGPTLDTGFTVVFSEEDQVTNPLGQWLAAADNPKGVRIELVDGRKMEALSKHVYMSILNGVPLTQLVKDGDDAKAVTDAAVFYHATRLLGNDVMNALTSPMGNIKDHEGVIVRNKLFGPKPVKITGEFIVKGLQTSFPRGSINEEIEIEVEEGPKVALLPGSFRPPTKGHFEMVKNYLSDPSVEVVVYVSSPTTEKRTIGGRSIDPIPIWNEYVAGMDRVHVLRSETPSPVTATYEFIGEFAPQNATVVLGCSEKGDDPSRFKGYEKYKREDVTIESLSCPVARHDPEYINLLRANEEILQGLPSHNSGKSIQDIHASDMRYLAELAAQNEAAIELLKYFIPDHANKDTVLSILGVGAPVQEKKTFTQLFSLVEGMLDEKKKKTDCFDHDKYETFEGKSKCIQRTKDLSKERADAYVASVLRDKGEIDEASSVAGGSVQGYSGSRPKRDDEIQGLIREDDLVEEVVNYLLGM